MSIKPKLAPFDLAMIVVSMVIGVGIFRTPSIIAAKAGEPSIFFAAWILGGLASICGSLTFAEIGSRYPTAGGFYKIFSHCYHPAYAFMLNWSLVVINAASAILVARVGAEYLVPVIFPPAMQTEINIRLIALAVTLILFALNFLGIRTGASTQNFLSLLKIGLIVIFSLAVFGHHTSSVSVSSHTPVSTFSVVKTLGICFISIFFTYGGYQNSINLGADIEKPEKNIPRAIFTGMGIVIALYMSINLAYYFVLGFDRLQQTSLPAADLAKAFFGQGGAIIASIAIFISTLGFINSSMLSCPRIYYAMAEDKTLPSIFKRINEKTMVQEFALGFFVALMLLSLLLLGQVEKIIDYVMFIDSLSLVSAAGVVFIFRYRERKGIEVPPADRHIYRMKLFPLVPLLFMIALASVTISVVISDFVPALYGFVILLAGYPLYWLVRKAIL